MVGFEWWGCPTDPRIPSNPPPERDGLRVKIENKDDDLR